MKGDIKVVGAQYTLYAASNIKNPETGSVICASLAAAGAAVYVSRRKKKADD
ncbi:hypothetical protein SAMN04487759_1083 [Kandleria vitulina]|uniref:LPXTG-motif cell wall anchor domain-containing protein n=1 Tax=Kandleria vitulina TaxID=1630 RepID=A0A1H2S2R6_9FIRM|nr:NPXTG-anchored protein [Kandleria vitulina]SDW25901.1 hypothetical protein SAMN04487759_1083 [Kandleria vitulina]